VAIVERDPDVFTFSIHGERNYPTRKMRSTLDVGLADGVGDDEYLGQLECRLAGIHADFRADFVFYLASVDIVQGDRYGRLALSDSGLRRRERQVLETCRKAALPVAITIAGGYAATPERTDTCCVTRPRGPRLAGAAPAYDSRSPEPPGATPIWGPARRIQKLSWRFISAKDAPPLRHRDSPPPGPHASGGHGLHQHQWRKVSWSRILAG
jgi:hypothetical protein